jgi:hypothetical protein
MRRKAYEDVNRKFYAKPVGVDQTPGLCGPAVLKSVLHYYGIHEDLEDITKKIKATPEKGIEAPELVRAAKQYGLKAFIDDDSSFKDIKKFLDQGCQVIVEWFKADDSHYSVVEEVTDDEIAIMDPELGEVKYITHEEFEPMWFTFPHNDDHKKPADKRIIVMWKEDKLGEKRMPTYKKHQGPPKDRALNEILEKKVGHVFGYDIYLVDGEATRNSLDIDFVMGGNPGRYKYVPNNQIWIESHYGDEELIPIVVHEIVECEYMIRDGDTYDKAHDKATKNEEDLRKHDKKIENLEEAEEYITGIFGKKSDRALAGLLPMGALSRFASWYAQAVTKRI